MKKISINLKINKGEILNELTRRSSYTALSVSPTIGEDNGIVDKLVLSSDDYPWSRDKLRMVFYKLRDILLPYSSGGDEFADENERRLIEYLMQDVYKTYGYDFHYYDGKPMSQAEIEELLEKCEKNNLSISDIVCFLAAKKYPITFVLGYYNFFSL